MTGEGRPLRFLVGVLGAWATLRVWMLWPAVLPIHLASRAQAAPALMAARAHEPRPLARAVRATPERVAVAAFDDRPRRSGAMVSGDVPILAMVEPTGRSSGDPSPAMPAASAAPPLLPGTVPLLSAPPRSRWSGSAWALLRGGTGAIGAAPVSQLGGAQAGVRVSYAVDAARRVALTARVSAPLSGPGREAGLGVAWRPTRAPVTVIAEQRVSLDGQRGGQALFAIAGLNPTQVAHGFRLEAYGEAGAVKRTQVEAFADGAARLSHPLGKRLDLGLGAWGGAQPGATRVDLGPSLGASLPIARHNLRLTLDWRERVAGRAKPGSGPALTVGTDF